MQTIRQKLWDLGWQRQDIGRKELWRPPSEVCTTPPSINEPSLLSLPEACAKAGLNMAGERKI
jgi:hypothetical protein